MGNIDKRQSRRNKQFWQKEHILSFVENKPGTHGRALVYIYRFLKLLSKPFKSKQAPSNKNNDSGIDTGSVLL